jgi:hypothetical protein
MQYLVAEAVSMPNTIQSCGSVSPRTVIAATSRYLPIAVTKSDCSIVLYQQHMFQVMAWWRWAERCWPRKTDTAATDRCAIVICSTYCIRSCKRQINQIESSNTPSCDHVPPHVLNRMLLLYCDVTRFVVRNVYDTILVFGVCYQQSWGVLYEVKKKNTLCVVHFRLSLRLWLKRVFDLHELPCCSSV